MRVLFAAAVSLVAAFVSAAGATPRLETLYANARGTVSGFAQDGSIIAWFTPGGAGCNTVHVRSLANGTGAVLPKQGATQNVTCRWNVGTSPVSLAISRDQPSVLWTLHESSPLQFDYLVGASVGDARERRYQQLAHTSRGAGLWLGGVAGSSGTLVYGVTSVDYVDEAGCLAGTDTCALKIVSNGGGVYRVGADHRPKLIAGTSGGAVEVATSGDRVAYVQAASIERGRPVAGPDKPIEVVDGATGQISTVATQGTPVAIALSSTALATLEQTPLGLRLAWYDPDNGSAAGSLPVAIAASPELAVSDRLAVFHVGRSIRAVDLATGRSRNLATAAGRPIGLSVEGTRVAWAENLKHGGWRIRAYNY